MQFEYWLLVAFAVLHGINTSNEKHFPNISLNLFKESILNAKNEESTLRIALINRLCQYESLSYCTRITKPNANLKSIVSSIKRAISIADSNTLALLEAMLPKQPDCSSPIWIIFHYKRLFLKDHTTYTISQLLAEWKSLQVGVKQRIKEAIFDLVTINITNKLEQEDLVSKLQEVVKNAIEYIDIVELSSVLLKYRHKTLGDVIDPTASDLARLIVADQIKHQAGKSSQTALSTNIPPKWYFAALSSVHIIKNFADNNALVNDVKKFIEKQTNLDQLFKKKVYRFAEKRLYTFLEDIYRMEKRICQSHDKYKVIVDYILGGKYGPRLLAQILKENGSVVFLGCPIEKIPHYYCKTSFDLQSCFSLLSKGAWKYHRKNYVSLKPTDPKLGNVPCKMEDFEFIKGLGDGAQGNVDLYLHKPTQLLVAIKTTTPTVWAKFPRMVHIEELLTTTIKHKNLGTAYCAFEDLNSHRLVLPFYSDGSLISLRGKINEATAVKYIAQILQGTMFLLESGFTHNDLKPENIMLDESGTIKIIDFGLAQQVDFDNLHYSINTRGTPKYRPGEALLNMPHGPAADIHSIGVIGWALLLTYEYKVSNITVEGFGMALRKGLRRFEPINTTPAYAELIALLTAPYPYDRWQSVYEDWEAFQSKEIFKDIKWKINPRNILEKSANSRPPEAAN